MIGFLDLLLNTGSIWILWDLSKFHKAYPPISSLFKLVNYVNSHFLQLVLPIVFIAGIRWVALGHFNWAVGRLTPLTLWSPWRVMAWGPTPRTRPNRTVAPWIAPSFNGATRCPSSHPFFGMEVPLKEKHPAIFWDPHDELETPTIGDLSHDFWASHSGSMTGWILGWVDFHVLP